MASVPSGLKTKMDYKYFFVVQGEGVKAYRKIRRVTPTPHHGKRRRKTLRIQVGWSTGYPVEFTQAAKKALLRLDKPTANILLSWIKRNLVDTDNPRRAGKAPKGDFKGAWRYRVGDFRLISHIDDKRILILILEIGHRWEIYR